MQEEPGTNKPEQTTCVKEELLILVVSFKIKYDANKYTWLQQR